MRYQIDVGKSQLNKHGEELCGDAVSITPARRSTLAVVSDGLGSGVKANILASLTTSMASTMVRQGAEIDDVMATLAETLPVCRVRRLAYSTFTMFQIHQDGRAYLAEYDNPLAVLGRGNEPLHIHREERKVGERVVRETIMQLQDGDWAVIFTDGVLHAGIGGLWNLGWGHERAEQFIRLTQASGCSPQELADEITSLVWKLYGGKPGDDTTVVCLRVRNTRQLVALIGPPQNPNHDQEVVASLMDSTGYRVVCGGTTANLVSREIGRKIEVDLSYFDARVPPMARIEGIDMVTEGMLTLIRVRELLVQKKLHPGALDAASRLAKLFLECDNILFIVGRAINPAHQSPDVPVELVLKGQIVQEIARSLRRHNIRVKVEFR